MASADWAWNKPLLCRVSYHTPKKGKSKQNFHFLLQIRRTVIYCNRSGPCPWDFVEKGHKKDEMKNKKN